MEKKKLLLTKFTDLRLSANSDVDALQQIYKAGISSGVMKESWLAAALEREEHSPTGLPTLVSVAIPHTDAEHALVDGIGFFRLEEQVEFGEMGSLDAKIPVKIVIPLLITDPKAQLDLLMTVISLVQNESVMTELIQLNDIEQIANVIDRFVASEEPS